MSNLGNIFGNEGWIQSSIDKSRGKSRPGVKRRKTRRQRSNRDEALRNDIASGRIPGVSLPTEPAPKAGLARLLQGILSSVPRGT